MISSLLIEDNVDDIEIIKQTLSNAGLKNPVEVCLDGDSALRYFHLNHRKNNTSSIEFPALILLDLNLPGTDGKEVLEQLKTRHKLKEIPIVILSTSANEKDIHLCYELGANSYLVKPSSIPGYVKLFISMKSWWFEMISLPEHK